MDAFISLDCRDCIFITFSELYIRNYIFRIDSFFFYTKFTHKFFKRLRFFIEINYSYNRNKYSAHVL